MTIPNGWVRVEQGRIKEGDKRWSMFLQQWIAVVESDIGEDAKHYIGVIRKCET